MLKALYSLAHWANQTSSETALGIFQSYRNERLKTIPKEDIIL